MSSSALSFLCSARTCRMILSSIIHFTYIVDIKVVKISNSDKMQETTARIPIKCNQRAIEIR